MKDYLLFTDATCDLSIDIANEFNIKIIPMGFTLGSDSYNHYVDFRELNRQAFYNRLENGEIAKTTAIPPIFYLEYFKPYLENGHDILYLCFSSGLSSTYQNAVLATNELKESYPDSNILVIDTLAASSGEGLLAIEAANKRLQGLSLQENYDYIQSIKMKLNHFYTPSDLFFLKRGGRISGSKAVVGTALKIKPILTVDFQGKLVPYKNTRGRKKALGEIVTTLVNRIENPDQATVIIACADCEEDREFLNKKLNDAIKVKKIYNTYLGPVIGAHTGKSLASVYFIGKDRQEN